MKLFKFLAIAALTLVSSSAIAGHVTVVVGGGYHGYGGVGYSNGYHGGYRGGYYRPNVVVVPHVVYQPSYYRSPEWVRVERYCEDRYGNTYFCGYDWVRR